MLFNSQTQDRASNALSENLGGLMRANSALGLSDSRFRNPLQQSDRLPGTSSATSTSTGTTFADLAGNSLTNARNITIDSTTPSRFSDWIGSTDTNDYYRFTLAANSNFNASVTRLSNDVDIQLLNSSGGVVASSAQGSTHDESITQSALAAGTYYLRAFQYSGDTLYALNLSSSTPSNLLAVENTLGTSGSTSGVINNTNTSDTMRLSLADNSRLNVSLTGLSADIDLRVVRDANSNGIMDAGEEITHSTNSGNSDESINLSGLAAGNYFIQAYQYSNNSSTYNLKFSTGGASDPSGLLPSAAHDIGQLSGTTAFTGHIDNNNSTDVYRFSVTNTSLSLPFSSSQISIPRSVDIILSGLEQNADVRLIQDINSNGIVDSGEELARSANWLPSADRIQKLLSTGSYIVQVYQDPTSKTATNYNLSLSTGDWYSQNLKDAGIIGQARALGLDGAIDRKDMLAILKETEDDFTISSDELTDLKTLLQQKASLMPDYVLSLANKIVNGDPANSRSGIGNLKADSRAFQMEELTDKWFLGKDHPVALSIDRTTYYTYQKANGLLVQNGINYQDVDQQRVGDCYFLASLAEVALRSSTTIWNPSDPLHSMFIDNGDDTWTVRLYHNGKPDFVTVDRYLPIASNGTAVYAGWGGGKASENDNELWVALAEKAYAQLNESGWIGQDNTNSYNGILSSYKPVEKNSQGINSGQPGIALAQITGKSTERNDVSDTTSFLGFSVWGSSHINEIISAFMNQKMVVLNTKSDGFSADGVNKSHSYALVNYSRDVEYGFEYFTLYNPWGHTIAISPGDLINHFDTWDVVKA